MRRILGSQPAILANLAAIALLVGYVLAQAFPSTEAVRLRNALILEVGTESDFEWTPKQVPAGFLWERREPLPQFAIDAKRVTGASDEGDWAKALSLAAMLVRNARRSEPVQADLSATYRAILEEGRGYCADYVDAYLALAHAAGLGARAWAFSFDGFGGHGHALVEVFDRSRQKWLFLDVFNNVHALDRESREPLSAMEFRDFVLGRRDAPLIQRNGPSRLGYRVETKLLDYYRKGANEWYLWWGNNVYSYEAQAAVRLTGYLSHSLGQLAAIAVGVHPRIKAMPIPDNRAQIDRMLSLRWSLFVVAGAVAALCVLLACQLFLATRLRGEAP